MDIKIEDLLVVVKNVSKKTGEDYLALEVKLKYRYNRAIIFEAIKRGVKLIDIPEFKEKEKTKSKEKTCQKK